MTSVQNFTQWQSHVELMKDMAKKRFYYKSGEIQLAQKLIKEALELYPLNHRYHQRTLSELTRYNNEIILKI
ncbi:MAG: hypothetical protein ACTSRX_12050 [Promethearchaeota archaeon]